mgnify:CR=1 FL=1
MAGIQTAPVPIQLQLPWTDFWDTSWWPRYPYATDDFSRGMYRTERETAVSKRYVQLNPQAVKNWLACDIDHVDGAMRALWDSEGQGLLPNLITENPHNGHVHALYALREPVTMTERARPEPIYLAASVTEGLRRRTDGDMGYSGFITKNPLHPDWDTRWLHQNLYELNDMRTGLGKDMPAFGWWRGRRESQSGLGRNVSLFESLRLSGYRLVTGFWFDSDGFYQALAAVAFEVNAQFAEPLPDAEVMGVVRSVHKWITSKSRLWRDGPTAYEAHFIALQSWRGKQSAQLRSERRRVQLEKVAEQLALLSPDGKVTNAQVAKAASVSERTVRRYRSMPRTEYLAQAADFRQAAIVLYAGGLSMPAIGETLGKHKSTVYRALTRL